MTHADCTPWVEAGNPQARPGRCGERRGLRPIVTASELAVLELRGGAHVVVRQTEQAPKPGTGAPFDQMVDDIDATHCDYAEKGLSPSPVRCGRIHDSFDLAGPDGWRFTVDSSHASGSLSPAFLRTFHRGAGAARSPAIGALVRGDR